MTDNTILNLPPETARALADHHMMQARALYARYGLARQRAESARQTRTGLQRARARVQAFMSALTLHFDEIERRSRPLPRANGPLVSGAEKERLREVTRQAVAAAAEQFQMRLDEALLLYKVGRRDREKAEQLRRKRQILHMYSVGKGDGEIAGALGIHPKTVNRAIRVILGKSRSHDRSLAAVERALAAIDQDLARLESKDEPESNAPVLPPAAVLDGHDAAGSDEPIVAAVARWWQAWDEHELAKVPLEDEFGRTWETDTSPADPRRARLNELQAEADRLWQLIMMAPSVSHRGICAKLAMLGDMLQDCDFSGLPEDLTHAIIADAARLAAGPAG